MVRHQTIGKHQNVKLIQHLPKQDKKGQIIAILLKNPLLAIATIENVIYPLIIN
jgi:hypothetical protein